MDPNPYTAPEAEGEPATRQPPRPRSIRIAAKSGAQIGAILMLSLYAIGAAFVLLLNLAGAIPLDDLHLGTALAGVVVCSLAASAFGATFGAVCQAVANAMIRRASKKTPPAN